MDKFDSKRMCGAQHTSTKNLKQFSFPIRTMSFTRTNFEDETMEHHVLFDVEYKSVTFEPRCKRSRLTCITCWWKHDGEIRFTEGTPLHFVGEDAQYFAVNIQAPY